MKTQLIITHPGSAHFDDVTAVSLILAAYPDSQFKVERREPTLSELDNPDIWVVDVGDRFEPEKRNFDHHQSLNSPSGFVLIAKYLGILDSMSVLPWWKFKDSVDRFGATNSSIWFNAGDELVNRNPIEEWLVNRFSDDPQAILPWLKTYGEFLINDAQRLKRQIDFWKNSTRLSIAGIPAMIGETRESIGLEEFRRLTENPPDIVISLDRRSEGWRLYRYEGTRVDFSRIANEPEIEFAHKTGFMAKTKTRLSIPELIILITKAIIPSY